MAEMNFYEMFGIEVPKADAESKDTKKTARSTKKKTDTKKVGYKLPLTIESAMGNLLMSATDGFFYNIIRYDFRVA